ncbi:MAG: hypothetical protein KDA24_17905 [Deltaproteobacteria bacterium]|nr:hypothetical protein [Deltaproteobacteria bacterium]
MSRLIVFDFDGTLTDAEEEGRPFRDGYLDDIATLCGVSLEEVDVFAKTCEAKVAANPQAHGWVFGGRIVAPATVDPYLRIMPVARMVFDHYGRLPDADDRDRLLDGILYKYNYPKTKTVFRDGAREVLLGTPAETTYVVTNSHTVPVQEKIRQLSAMGDDADALLWLVERVHGRAKKYVLDDSFDDVPEELRVPNLSRPILLRRRLYYEALTRLLEERGADWSELTVVGDIFELDLALPLALGATVGLVANAHTPQYEMDYLEAHERGRVLHSLPEVGEWLAG